MILHQRGCARGGDGSRRLRASKARMLFSRAFGSRAAIRPASIALRAQRAAAARQSDEQKRGGLPREDLRGGMGRPHQGQPPSLGPCVLVMANP
jgi:hypothetical protein